MPKADEAQLPRDKDGKLYENRKNNKLKVPLRVKVRN